MPLTLSARRPHHAAARRPGRARGCARPPRPSWSTRSSTRTTAGEPVLVLGGGSNLVVADEGFDGTVVEVATRGSRDRRRRDDADLRRAHGHGRRRREPGTTWSRSPSSAAGSASRRSSGIPGLGRRDPDPERRRLRPGGRQTIASVRVWDRTLARRAHLRQRRLRLRLPHLALQGRPRRGTSCSSVTFQLRQGDLGAPVAYAELARALGVELGERAPLADVREAVLGAARAARAWCSTRPTTTPGAPARSSPTRSSTPPTRARRRAGLAAARRPRQDQRRLADRARRLRARATAPAPVALSSKHTLALTNRGGATTERAARARPRGPRRRRGRAFGVRLVNEPVLVGCEL